MKVWCYFIVYKCIADEIHMNKVKATNVMTKLINQDSSSFDREHEEHTISPVTRLNKESVVKEKSTKQLMKPVKVESGGDNGLQNDEVNFSFYTPRDQQDDIPNTETKNQEPSPPIPSTSNHQEHPPTTQMPACTSSKDLSKTSSKSKSLNLCPGNHITI